MERDQSAKEEEKLEPQSHSEQETPHENNTHSEENNKVSLEGEGTDNQDNNEGRVYCRNLKNGNNPIS